MATKEELELQKERIAMGLEDPDDLINGDNAVDDEDGLFEDDEDDESEDDEEDVDEDGDGNSSQDHSGGGISPKKFARVRGREAAARREARELKTELDAARSKLKEQEDAENAKPAISDDDIKAEASGMVVYPPNATEEQKKMILQTAEAQLRRVVNLVLKGTKPSKELGDLASKYAALEDKQVFSEEWDDFSDNLPKVYPNATPKQFRLAKRAMDSLSHSPKFADKEFDYVFYKNRDIFDQIFRKARTHTFEGRSTMRGREDSNDDDRSNAEARHLTPKELEKRNKQIDAEATAIDRKGGWNIMNPDGNSAE